MPVSHDFYLRLQKSSVKTHKWHKIVIPEKEISFLRDHVMEKWGDILHHTIKIVGNLNNDFG